MSNNTPHLFKKIMRRVYCIYALRYITQPFLVKTYILIVLFWRSAAYISFADVAYNAKASFPHIFGFGREAFVHTEGITLFYVSLAFLFLILLSKDALNKLPVERVARSIYEYSRSIVQVSP